MKTPRRGYVILCASAALIVLALVVLVSRDSAGASSESFLTAGVAP